MLIIYIYLRMYNTPDNTPDTRPATTSPANPPGRGARATPGDPLRAPAGPRLPRTRPTRLLIPPLPRALPTHAPPSQWPRGRVPVVRGRPRGTHAVWARWGGRRSQQLVRGVGTRSAWRGRRRPARVPGTQECAGGERDTRAFVTHALLLRRCGNISVKKEGCFNKTK